MTLPQHFFKIAVFAAAFLVAPCAALQINSPFDPLAFPNLGKKESYLMSKSHDKNFTGALGTIADMICTAGAQGDFSWSLLTSPITLGKSKTYNGLAPVFGVAASYALVQRYSSDKGIKDGWLALACLYGALKANRNHFMDKDGNLLMGTTSADKKYDSKIGSVGFYRSMMVAGFISAAVNYVPMVKKLYWDKNIDHKKGTKHEWVEARLRTCKLLAGFCAAWSLNEMALCVLPTESASTL